MSNKMIKKATACTLSAVMAFGLVAVTDAPKTTNVSAANKDNGHKYTAKKSNGKYTIELPASIGKDLTITQTVTVTK